MSNDYSYYISGPPKEGTDYASLVQQAATDLGVPVDFALALHQRGEQYNPKFNVSPKGATGPMQVMPETFRQTAAKIGLQDADINNPEHNAYVGVAYAKEMLDRFNNDPALASAAYNAGPGAVEKYGGVPPYKETQGYVKRIMNALSPSEAMAAGSAPTGKKMEIIDPFKSQPATSGDTVTQPVTQPSPSADIKDPFKDPNFDASAALGGGKQTVQPSGMNIPEAAPEWARQHPELYQNIVKTVNAFELPGDVGSMMYGAQLGATGGAVAGPIGSIVGGVAGAGLGYGINKQGLGILKQYLGMEKPPETVTEGMTNAASDVAKGMEMEMAGGAGVKALSKGAELAGGVAKNALGRLTGTGTKAVEEAIESGKQIGLANPFKTHTDFAKAMRGEISADEVVSNAKDALNVIKDARQKAYMDRLANITGAGGTGVVPSAGQSATGTVSQSAGGGPLIDVKPAFTKIEQLMKRYNVNLNPDGTFDLSRVAMGKKGRNDIEGVLETMRGWGKQPGDNTAMGLDTLKRQLDDFYSESGQARQFVTSMRNIVKKLITDNVPEYAKMTEEYAESTKLIKDLEAGLMMRKQGMTGRIVSDQTLRRLTSSMRDNFKLRGELVDMLSSTGGVDVSAQVAGHAMSEFIPRGIAGTGPSLIGQGALATYVSPYFWGVLAASSPRVSGEFLQLYGQALGTRMGLKPVAQRVLGRSLVNAFTDKDKRQELESEMGKWVKDQLPVVSP